MTTRYLFAGASTAFLALAATQRAYAKEASGTSGKARVWMCGSKFAIPNGSLVDLDRPTPISWFTETGLEWKKITTGPHFGASLASKEGRVYVWAYDKSSQSHIPPRDLGIKEVVDIASTEHFLVVLDRKGADVNLIDPVTFELVATLTIPQASSWLLGRRRRFISVSAGRHHVALLDDLGRVWTAGNNTDGQCGRRMTNDQKKINRFNYYESDKSNQTPQTYFNGTLACVWDQYPATEAVCGGSHTVIVCKDGKAYSFGDDSKIQLGLGDTRSQDMPDYVPHSGMGQLNADVTDMSKLFQPTMPAVKYTFYDRHFRSKISEMKVPEPNVTGAVLGDNFTILRMGDSGRMLACGENQLGQCGRGLNKQQQTLAPVKLPRHVKPVHVSCGLSHCVASLEDGSVHSWGGNSSGQLGCGNRAPSCPPVTIHRSKIRGLLIEDIITRVGRDDVSKADLEAFLEERKRDSITTQSQLSKESTLLPPAAAVDKVPSNIKQELLNAIDRSRAELMMSPQEQSKWVPIMVHASFNNSVIVMEEHS